MNGKESMYGVTNNGTQKKTVTEKLDYGVRKSGSVTEITLGDKTFEVLSPEKINKMFNMIEKQTQELFELRQYVKKQTQTISLLSDELNQTKMDITKLKELNNGYGSNEYF